MNITEYHQKWFHLLYLFAYVFIDWLIDFVLFFSTLDLWAIQLQEAVLGMGCLFCLGPQIYLSLFGHSHNLWATMAQVHLVVWSLIGQTVYNMMFQRE